MSIELRHLRAIVALEEAESFTAAAEMLGVTQPTLSRTISQLEELLGADLVMRTTRSLRLTEHGAEVVDQGRALLAGLDRLVSSFDGSHAGPLRLGWAWAGLGKHTLALIKQWQGVSRSTIEASRPDDLLLALERSRIDTAIVKRARGEAPLPENLIAAPLFTETLVAAISTSNRLSAQDEVSLDDLADGAVALCSVSPTASLRLWEGRERMPASLLAGNTDEWLVSVALDEAVGVTSAATAYGHRSEEVVYRSISDAPPVEVSIVWRRDRVHPACIEFAEFAQAYFRELAGQG
ncbi:LysR family transcriptional regulator [Leucobacter sp. GX24907]